MSFDILSFAKSSKTQEQYREFLKSNNHLPYDAFVIGTWVAKNATCHIDVGSQYNEHVPCDAHICQSVYEFFITGYKPQQYPRLFISISTCYIESIHYNNNIKNKMFTINTIIQQIQCALEIIHHRAPVARQSQKQSESQTSFNDKSYIKYWNVIDKVFYSNQSMMEFLCGQIGILQRRHKHAKSKLITSKSHPKSIYVTILKNIFLYHYLKYIKHNSNTCSFYSPELQHQLILQMDIINDLSWEYLDMMTTLFSSTFLFDIKPIKTMRSIHCKKYYYSLASTSLFTSTLSSASMFMQELMTENRYYEMCNGKIPLMYTAMISQLSQNNNIKDDSINKHNRRDNNDKNYAKALESSVQKTELYKMSKNTELDPNRYPFTKIQREVFSTLPYDNAVYKMQKLLRFHFLHGDWTKLEQLFNQLMYIKTIFMYVSYKTPTILFLMNTANHIYFRFDYYSKKNLEWRLNWILAIQILLLQSNHSSPAYFKQEILLLHKKYSFFNHDKLIRIVQNMAMNKECNWIECKRKTIKLQRCKKCKSVFYCSKKCQKLDWKTSKLNKRAHRYCCKALKRRDLSFVCTINISDRYTCINKHA